tara:strand:- start:244 stop:1302 length:1059 start_codon:yes stop_codon:yes gene_type:complete
VAREKILLLTKDMSAYKGASYQQDVINALSLQADVHKYGPGFAGFDNSDTIDAVLAKSPIRPDFILLSHSWLPDNEATPFLLPKCDFAEANVPVVAILNKEYVNLEKKVNYLTAIKCRLVFSHHHRVRTILPDKKFDAIFWPFGYDEKKICARKVSRHIDLAFSGILLNQLSGAEQTSSRLDVMRELFFCWGDLPMKKKPGYQELNIFWNGMPRVNRRNASLLGKRLQKLIFPKYGYRHLPERQYFDLLSKSKLLFNSLSPLGLIGPRFVEAMASGAVVIAERQPDYQEVFPEGLVVQFDSLGAGFGEILLETLYDEDKRQEMSRRGRNLAYKHHQWQYRVDSLLDLVRKLQ